jgi:predicted lipoprotein with Yx(FWY)xxD motif
VVRKTYYIRLGDWSGMRLTRRDVLAATTTAAVALAGCSDDDGGGDDDGAGDDGGDTPTDAMDATETETEDGGSADVTVQVREHPDHGDILVGPGEMTLYNFDQDTQGAGESTCYDTCEGQWPPLTIEDEPVAGEGVTADLTTFERDDGEMQVAAGGWPLYYYTPDEDPGDTLGQGANGVWWVLGPDGSVKRDS